MIKLKNLLLIFIGLALQGNVIAQSRPEIVTIKTDIYTTIYNTEYQQPIVVEYTIFVNQIHLLMIEQVLLLKHTLV